MEKTEKKVLSNADRHFVRSSNSHDSVDKIMSKVGDNTSKTTVWSTICKIQAS